MNDLLKSLAPLLGNALAGPFGGIAASFIADKLGLESQTIEAVGDVLSNGKITPEQLSAIKLAEIDFKKFMADHDIKLEQLSVQNTQGARDMQVATKSWVPSALAMVITLGYLGILIGLMLGVLTVADNQVLLILVGALASAFGTVLNFFLGSSRSSNEKTALLARAEPLK